MYREKITPEGVSIMVDIFQGRELSESMSQAVVDVIRYNLNEESLAAKYQLNVDELDTEVNQMVAILDNLDDVIELLEPALKDHIKAAVVERLVTGRKILHCAEEAGIKQPNLVRSLNKLRHNHSKMQEAAALYKTLNFSKK